MGSKADLHILSRYSTRAEEWAFRRFNVAASYSDPDVLYQRLKVAGMDFVTLTDDNSIEGCQRLLDMGYDDVFLSECVVSHFPDSKGRINILVWGISEGQHRDLMRLRGDIYELQGYLARENLTHAVAHPFYDYNRDITLRDLERLILLFRHFEGLNGHRDLLYSEVATHVLTKLTPQKIDELANRHDLGPRHQDTWRKILVGGSGDRAGLFVASAYTETGQARSLAEFLRSVREGQCEPHGQGGTPLRLAHSTFNTLFAYVKKEHLKGDTPPGLDLLDRNFRRFLSGENPMEFDLMDKINFVVQSVVSGKVFELTRPGTAAFLGEILTVLEDRSLNSQIRRETADIVGTEKRAFAIANVLFNRLYFHFTESFFRHLEARSFVQSLQNLSALLPLAAVLGPYFYGFQSQSPPRKWLSQVSRGLTGSRPRSLARRKRAWFTDTLDDVNGVATTIRRMTSAGVAKGAEITVVASRSALDVTDIPIKNFKPIGEFPLPEYENQLVTLPPVLEIMEYVQREGFTDIIISTPGPVGLVGLFVARILGLRTIGIYHTDFPQYARILGDDHFLESLTWKYMHWFYNSQDVVYVNSEHYRQSWRERNISIEKLKILPRGLDTQFYHPSRRDPGFWERFGGRRNTLKLLYVGRISREKDLEVIAEAARHFQAVPGSELDPANGGYPGWELVFVGHGPFTEELHARLPKAIFTGPLRGADLAAAYAGGDVFLFPSTTDTFGNVVIEAQASGLPCIVSDMGGPRDLVRNGHNGFITRSLDAQDFAAAVNRLITNPTLRQAMGKAGRSAVETRSWPAAFQRFWDLGEF
jgi:glycosyltransferase involved in cell wall biosynthesis